MSFISGPMRPRGSWVTLKHKAKSKSDEIPSNINLMQLWMRPFENIQERRAKKKKQKKLILYFTLLTHQSHFFFVEVSIRRSWLTSNSRSSSQLLLFPSIRICCSSFLSASSDGVRFTNEFYYTSFWWSRKWKSRHKITSGQQESKLRRTDRRTCTHKHC